MKLFFLVTCLFSGAAVADEYRYNLMATTGLQERVFSKEGDETMVVFSKESTPAALFLLRHLTEAGGLNGTKGKELWSGVAYEQSIFVEGKFLPGIRRTVSGEGLPAAEDYREFVLENVIVGFPLMRHRDGKHFDTGYLETHFSFKTLFPDGVEFEGRSIDLNEHSRIEKPAGSTR